METISFNNFGFPLIQRKEEIAKKIQSPESHYTIEIMGRRKSLPVISVRIEFPVYRLANGRTRSAQLEYLTLNKDVPRDLFTADNDSYDAQKAQHEILKDLVRDEDLLSSFQSGELEQVDPILCTNTGVVVNGNRRLCAWRMLYYGDKTRYKTFETVLIAVLPEMDEKGILDIEKKLQILKPLRAEYRWHTKALMAELDLQSGIRDTDVARSFDMSKKDLMKLIEARHIACYYLEKIGHPNEWSRLDKSQYAFESMVVGGKKILDPNQKELFQKLTFDLITKGFDPTDDSAGDRLYNKIKEYAEHIEAIAAKMAPKMTPVAEGQDSQNDASSQNDGKEEKPVETKPIVPDNDDDAALLSGGETITPDSAGVVSTAIDNGAKIQHEQIGEIIEAQKALKDEKNHAVYLTGQLSKVVAILDTAISSGLDENTNTEGIPKQLDEIQKWVDYLRNWLSNKR